MAEIKDLKGRLGFPKRDHALLSLGVTQAADLLEEWGHPINRIDARARNQIRLESDEYRIQLRLRRLPMRSTSSLPDGLLPPSVYLDVHLHPAHPILRDPELDDLLLAVLLQRLAQRLAPLVVYWQDETKAILCDDFLKAFDAEPAQGIVAFDDFEDLDDTDEMHELADYADDLSDLFESPHTAEARDHAAVQREGFEIVEDVETLSALDPADLFLTPTPIVLEELAPIRDLMADAPTMPVAEKIRPARPLNTAVFYDVDSIAEDLETQCEAHVQAARQGVLGKRDATPHPLARLTPQSQMLKRILSREKWQSAPKPTPTAKRLQRVISIAIAWVFLQSSGVVQAASKFWAAAQ